MTWTTLLFSFRGRLNRAKYWRVWLTYLAMFAVCFIFAIIGIGVASAIPSSRAIVSYATMAPFAIVTLVTMWSSTATGIKRLHDRNQSGWWMLGFLAISTLVSLLQEIAPTPSSKVLFTVAGFAVTVWIMIELGCLRGTRGPNLYGPDPLEASQRR